MKMKKKLMLWLAAAALMCSVLSATPALAETTAEPSETVQENRKETEWTEMDSAQETEEGTEESSLTEPASAEAALAERENAAASVESRAEEIQGTFVLAGDEAHGATGHEQFQIWLEVPFTARQGQTVYDVLEKVLRESGYTFEVPDSGYGKYLTSVTSPSGVTLKAGTNGPNSGWMYYVNYISASASMDRTELKDGDRVQLLYVDDYASDPRIDGNFNITGEIDQREPAYEGTLPEYASEWNSFRGNASNNGVTSAAGPASANEAGLKWMFSLKEASDWATNVSDPVIVNGQIYIAAGDRMKVLDASGKLVREGSLAETVGYTCRIAYAEGMILVPLSGGGVQALAADTLETVWKTPGKDSKYQALTTLTCADGMAYLGTAEADWSSSYSGTFRCIDLSDGRVVWEHENNSAGYYWSGAAAANGCVFFAGDDGVLRSADAKTGAEKAEIKLSSGVRSSVVADGGYLYVVSTDGALHQVEIQEDGTFGAHRSVSFAAYSTSTPAIAGGRAYVGGSRSDYSGVLAVIDVKTMTVAQTADAEKEVKSAPLVSTGNGGRTCVYYTSNTTPGALYIFCPETGVSETLFVPDAEHQNYCMASVMADGAGTLYYTNDSGTLFAVGKTSVPETEATEEGSSETEAVTETETQTESQTETQTEAAPAESGDANDSPATGDRFQPQLLMVILLISGTVLFAAGRKRKRA